MTKKFLTSADVKELLQISDSTLYRLKRDKILEPLNTEGPPRYLEEDVLQERDRALLARRGRISDTWSQNQQSEANVSLNYLASPQTKKKFERLRFLYITWAIILLVLLFLDNRYIGHYIGSAPAETTDWNPPRMILLTILGLIAFVYVVMGVIRPRKRNATVLKLLGQSVQWSWVLALVIMGIWIFLPAAKLSGYRMPYLVFSILAASVLGFYTDKVCRETENK